MAWPCGTYGTALAAIAVGGGAVEQRARGEGESEGGGGSIRGLRRKGVEQQDAVVAYLYRPSMVDAAMPSMGKRQRARESGEGDGEGEASEEGASGGSSAPHHHG